ncbi:cell wall-binding repeat-containing protein [Euzebya pacifica]|uniref:cell wall-binding repeat-containing protein n=1 Tax=Euzebya pacifica TaxID=1608957 RepID=UPI000DF8041A|nr:cell wall-binding repeat-containing protein [Euzebya pacifica]
MRKTTWGPVVALVVLATMLLGGVASAQLLEGDAAAVRRATPTLDNVTSAEQQAVVRTRVEARSATTASTLTAGRFTAHSDSRARSTQTPEEVDAACSTSDDNNGPSGNVGTLDLGGGGAGYCNEGNGVFSLGGIGLTYDTWADSSLGAFMHFIDADNNPNTGCNGFEFNTNAFHDPGAGLVAGLFANASCTSTDLIDIVEVFRPSSSSVATIFDAALIGSPETTWSVVLIDGTDLASPDIAPHQEGLLYVTDRKGVDRDPQPAGGTPPAQPDPEPTGQPTPVPPMTSRPIQRLEGPSRFDTAIAISRYQFPNGAAVVYLSRADVFADSIAAASLTGGPVLLVPQCGQVPDQVLDEVIRLDPATIVPLGGQAAVCDQVARDVAAARPPA